MNATRARRSLTQVAAWLIAVALVVSLVLPAETTNRGNISFLEFVAEQGSGLTPIEWLLVAVLLVGAGIAVVGLAIGLLEPGLGSSGGWSTVAGFAAALIGVVLWTIDFSVHAIEIRGFSASLGPAAWLGSIAAWLGFGTSLYLALSMPRSSSAAESSMPEFPVPGAYSQSAVEPSSTISGDDEADWSPSGVARLSYMDNGEPWNVVVGPGELLLVGSDDTADVRLEDPRVSPHHAMVEWRDGRWFITELTSANPMQVVDAAGRTRRIYGRVIMESGMLLVGDVALTLHRGLARAS